MLISVFASSFPAYAGYSVNFLPIRHIRLGLSCSPGIRILFLLEDTALKYTPSYDEVKEVHSPTHLRNQGLNIKCQLKLHS